jgi:hypothetical protein
VWNNCSADHLLLDSQAFLVNHIITTHTNLARLVLLRVLLLLLLRVLSSLFPCTRYQLG